MNPVVRFIVSTWLRYRIDRRRGVIRDLRNLLRTEPHTDTNLYMLELIDRNRIDEARLSTIRRTQ